MDEQTAIDLYNYFVKNRNCFEQTFTDGLEKLWKKKKDIRSRRRDRMLKNRSDEVRGFDIYGAGASAYKSVAPATLVHLLRLLLTDGVVKNFAVLVSGGRFDVTVPTLRDVADFKATGESGPTAFSDRINLLDVDGEPGLLQLATALLSKIYDVLREDKAWDKQDAKEKNESAKEAVQYVRELATAWGFSPNADDPGTQIESRLNWVVGAYPQMLAAAAYRVFVAKKAVSTSSQERESAIPDDQVNPRVVDVAEIDGLLDMSQKERREYAMKRYDEMLAVMKRFDEEVVGLFDIKRNVKEYVQALLFAPQRVVLGPNHLVLTGGPGTGKTKIAELLALTIKSLGVLNSRQKWQVVGRKDFVSPFVGATAEKTQNTVLINGYENVMFFDEAYTLNQGPDDRYGVEALNGIFEFINNYPEFIIIFAGYQSQINDALYKAQPGLERRVFANFNFRGYSAEQMFLIAKGMFDQQIEDGLINGVSDEAREEIRERLQASLSRTRMNKDYRDVTSDLRDLKLIGVERSAEFSRLISNVNPLGDYAGDMKVLVDKMASKAALDIGDDTDDDTDDEEKDKRRTRRSARRGDQSIARVIVRPKHVVSAFEDHEEKKRAFYEARLERIEQAERK